MKWIKTFKESMVNNNLNKIQNYLIHTIEFKNWFGDWENDIENSSKVVDKNGTPLIVYHGSNSIIDVFDTQKIHASGEQVYKFTTNKEAAADYGKYVYQCFLNINNKKIGHWSAPHKGMAEFYMGGKTFDMARLDLIYNSKKAMDAQGGVIYDLTSNDLKHKMDVYFVHDSNQIKLADGSNTTFNINDFNIRK
jgi:hypothetical protein